MKLSAIHRLTSIKARDFAPTFITSLAAVAVLGYAHLAAFAEGQDQHFGKIDLSKGVTQICALDKGNYAVQFADDRVVKFDPLGMPLWEIPFDRLDQLPKSVVLSIAAEPLGDVLALGITPDTKMATLYRVSGKGPKPTVSLVGQYPGLSPSRVAVAPDGTAYLTAYNQEALLRSIADSGQLPREYIERPIHELDSQGRIARSFGAMRTHPDSVQGLGDFLTLSVGRSLVFSPSGNAYLMDSENFELERVDLDSGELTGDRVRLAWGSAAQHANLDGLVFLDESSVLYTVARLRDPVFDHLGRTVISTPVGWEVRIASLEDGTSFRLQSSQSPGSVTLLSFSDLEAVTLVNDFNPSAGHASHRWFRFDLLERLARQ